jgi:general secretion pathway protein J
LNKHKFFGFTLLEILVVLVLVGFISTLLLQGFVYILQIRTRFITQLDDLQKGAMQEYWFRSSVIGILADFEPTKTKDFFQANKLKVFKGEKHLFDGLTIAALNADAGVPIGFTWEINYESDGYTYLNYINHNNETWHIMRWLGDLGEFNYMAKDGEWHSQWPPKFTDDPPQLPRAIMLLAKRRQTEITWLVKLIDLNNPKRDYRLQENSLF